MKMTGKITLGILCAASAGVLIGMLIAPEKGEDLRADLKNSANDLIKKFGDLLSQGKADFDNLKDEAADDVSGLKSEMNDLQEEATKAYKRSKI